MKINYHVLTESVVINYEGKTFTIPSSDGRYNRVIEAIKASKVDPAKLEEIPGIVEIEKSFQDIPGLSLRDGLLYDGEIALPNALSNRILAFRDQGLPMAPLFKFWENLKKNPSFNSRQALFKFLEHNGHPITEEGEFIAYRGIREDFKDKHTGQFDNSPGQTLEMPRESVDDNPNNTCSHGFHVACFDYARGFGEKLVEVKVNPADVVTVPTDYNGTKMRVCKFTVIQEVKSVNGQELYGHGDREVPQEQDEEEEFEEFEEEEIEEEEEEEALNEFCPHCGAATDQNDHFCRKCGEEL